MYNNIKSSQQSEDKAKHFEKETLKYTKKIIKLDIRFAFEN